MSIETVVICDGCGADMAGAKTAAAARRDARESGFALVPGRHVADWLLDVRNKLHPPPPEEATRG